MGDLVREGEQSFPEDAQGDAAGEDQTAANRQVDAGGHLGSPPQRSHDQDQVEYRPLLNGFDPEPTSGYARKREISSWNSPVAR